MVLIELGGVLGALGRSGTELTGEVAATYRALLVLGNGFILTAVLWGSAVVPSGAVFWPWTAGAPLAVAAPLAGAYGVLSALALLAAASARTR